MNQGYPPPQQQPPQKKGMSTLAIVLIVLGVLLVLGLGTCVGVGFYLKGKVDQAVADGGLVLVAPPEVKAALAGPKKDYVGVWHSKSNSSLVIDAQGNFAMTLHETHSNENLTAPIAAFKGNDIEIHAFVTVVVPVTSPPKCDATTCTMTAKGVQFERPAK